MLVTVDKFGGLIPRIKDPALVPLEKSVTASMCLFDQGGLIPLGINTTVASPTLAGTKQSIYLYRTGATSAWFAWLTDVNVVRAPLASDTLDRVFYTESGVLKVTDKNHYAVGGTNYPMTSHLPSPPAPSAAPTCVNATKLVLNGNGVHGSTNINDSSAFQRRLSNVGTTVDSTNKVYGSGSLLFNVTSLLYVQEPSGPAMTANEFFTGTQAFAIHFRMKAQDQVGSGQILYFANDVSNQFLISSTAAGGTCTITVLATFGGVTHSFSVSFAYSAAAPWKHIAIIRGWGGATTTAAGWQITVDGVAGTKTVISDNPAVSISAALPTFVLGYNLKANIDEFVVTGNYTPWTANFTPPAIPQESDPTLLETRGYVYTYVNSYGAEGPPSAVSTLLDAYDGNTILITGMSTGPAADYDVTLKRIYRLNQAASGTPEYQFVVEIAVATATYNDTILDSSLGEPLPSAEWDAAPSGLTGLIALPDGSLAGFVGNLLCRSVPNYPHAWPTAYQKPVDSDIVGLGAYGTTIVVLTEGTPYLAIGNDPANVVLEKMDLGFSCTSKAGIVDAGDVIIYPSPLGMAAIGAGGAREIITDSYMTPSDWQSYRPSTVEGYYWRGKYVGFYLDGDSVGRSGFMIDLKTKDFISLNFYATAGYHDPSDGTLYLMVGGNVVSFASSATLAAYDYRTKKYRFPKNTLAALKVLALAYPVTLDIRMVAGSYTVTKTVSSSAAVKIKPKITDDVDIRIYGSSGSAGKTTAIFLATTLEELPA